jgi:hypothetical protein
MRHPPPRWFTGTLLAIALTLVGGSALAYFTGDGLGRASAAVTQLSAPTIASATPGAGGTVALAWSSVSPPGPETVKYYVTRDGGDPAGNCAAPAVPAAATSCNDGGVSVGTHSYRVTAIWRSWSATSAVKTATVAVGEATHFTLTAATTAPAVGAADKLTITARDANENVVATYSGSHSLVFSGASSSPSGAAPTVVDSAGTAVNFGSPTALTFTAGVAAVASAKNGVMKLNNAGAAAVAASDGTFTTPAVAFTVSTGAPTRLAISSPSASAGTIGSPCVFTCTVTKIGNGGALSANVAATDGLGNVVSELGSGHTAKITASTGSLAEGTLTLAATGPAISATRFTFTAPVNGNFTATVTIATLAGTAYTGATATVTK